MSLKWHLTNAGLPLKKMNHQLNDKKFAYMNTTFMACNNVYCSRETDKALKVQDFLRR